MSNKQQKRAALKPRTAADGTQTATNGAQAPNTPPAGAEVAKPPENATQADPGTASETPPAADPPAGEPPAADNAPAASDPPQQADDAAGEGQPPAEAAKPVVGAVASEQALLDHDAALAAAAVKTKQSMGQNVNDFTAMMESIDPATVDDVIVESPKAFRLTLDNHAVVQIKAGVQRVPRYVAEHWYSKANGLTIFQG